MMLAYFTWNISPEILQIGPVAIRWYGLLFALAFVLGYSIMSKIYIQEKRTQKDMEALTVTMIVGTIVGARLGHCLFYDPVHYLAHPFEIIKVWEGGLASHGAAIGIILALYYYVKKRPKFSLLWILDRVVIVVALAGFLIRMGNFFNSEILGSPANVPWAVIFSRIDSIPRHPAQLYEALIYLSIFLYLYLTYRNRKGRIGNGFFFGLFLILVFGFRFIIEFVKDVQSSWETTLPLDMGQILSLPFILVGIYFVFRAYKIKESK
jgi:prolipoprotein diacylglyceryl transferase